MKVRITHPDLPGRESYVHPRAVPVWRRSGWMTDDELPAEPAKTEPTRRRRSSTEES